MKANIVLLPGDGIGPEVMAEVKLLIDWINAKGLASFETEQGLVGGSAYWRQVDGQIFVVFLMIVLLRPQGLFGQAPAEARR